MRRWRAPRSSSASLVRAADPAPRRSAAASRTRRRARPRVRMSAAARDTPSGFLKSMQIVGRVTQCVDRVWRLLAQSTARETSGSAAEAKCRYAMSGAGPRLAGQQPTHHRQMFAAKEKFPGNDIARHTEYPGRKDLLLHRVVTAATLARCYRRQSRRYRRRLPSAWRSMTRGSSMSSSRFQKRS